MQFVVKKWYEKKISGKDEEVMGHRRKNQPDVIPKVKIIAAPPSIHPFTTNPPESFIEQYRYPIQHFYGYKLIKEPMYVVSFDLIRKIVDVGYQNTKECEYQLKLMLSSHPDNEYYMNFANKGLDGPKYSISDVKLPMIQNRNDLVFPCMDDPAIHEFMGEKYINTSVFKYVGTISININHERNTFRIKAFIFIYEIWGLKGIIILNASPGYGFLKMEEISHQKVIG